MVFYSTVVAQAQKIEVAPGGITFTFAEGQRTLRDMFEQNKAWLETLAQQVSGRRIPVVSATLEAGVAAQKTPDTVASDDKKAALKAARPGRRRRAGAARSVSRRNSRRRGDVGKPKKGRAEWSGAKGPRKRSRQPGVRTLRSGAGRRAETGAGAPGVRNGVRSGAGRRGPANGARQTGGRGPRSSKWIFSR